MTDALTLPDLAAILPEYAALIGLLGTCTPAPWWQKSHETPTAPTPDAKELSELLVYFEDEGEPRFWDWINDGGVVVAARNAVLPLLRELAAARRAITAVRSIASQCPHDVNMRNILGETEA